MKKHLRLTMIFAVLAAFGLNPAAGQSKKNAPDPFGSPQDPFVSGAAQAQADDDPFAPNRPKASKRATAPRPEMVIAVSSEFIEVPRDAWLEAMGSGDHEGRDARPLRELVQEWLDAGDASYVASNMNVTISGQRTGVESVLEFMYPTELEASGPNHRFPVAFETRSLGHTLEVDPVLVPRDPGENHDPFAPDADADVPRPTDHIDINVASEFARYAGEYRYGYEPNALGGEPLVIEPVFRIMQSTAMVKMKPGAYRLLDSFAGLDEGGAPQAETKVLSFLRADLAEIMAPSDFDPVSPNPEFGLTFEWIEVDTAWWSRWLLESSGTTLLAGARAAVDAHAEAAHAEIVEVVHMPAVSGARSKSESILTFTYCNDWGPAEDETSHSKRNSCDVRHLGVTVEVDPVLGEEGFVHLNLAPEIVQHVGENVHQRIPGTDQWVPDVTTPLFYTRKTTTATWLALGEPLLVSVMAPPDEEGYPNALRKTLLFVTAKP